MSGSLGSLYVSLEAKLGSFVDGMTKAQTISKAQMRQIQRNADQFASEFSQTFKEAGLAATAAFVGISAAVKDTLDQLEQQLDASRQLNIPLQQYTALSAAAKVYDVSTQSITVAMQQLIRQQTQFASGSKLSIAAFQALGVDPTKFKTTVDLFNAVTEGLRNVTNPTEKLQLELQLLGRSGSELNPIINASSKEFQELQKQAIAVGAALGPDAANSYQQADDAFKKLEMGVTGLKTSIVVALLPYLTQLADKFEAWIEIANQNGTIAKIADAIKTLGNIVLGLVSNWQELVIVFAAFKLLPIIQSVVSLTSALGELSAVGLIGLINPVTAVVTVIAALAAGILYLNNSFQIFKDPSLDASIKQSSSDIATMQGHVQALATSWGDAATNLGVYLQQDVAKIGLDWTNQATQVRDLASNLSDAKDQLTKLQQQKAAYSNSTGGQHGNIAAQGTDYGMQTNIDNQKAKIAAMQKSLDEATAKQKQIQDSYYAGQSAIDQARKQSTMKGPTSTNNFNALLNQSNPQVMKAASAYEKLVDAVNNLDIAAGNSPEDIAAKAMRTLASTGAAAIKAGKSVQLVQAQVAKGAAEINQKMVEQYNLLATQEAQYQQGLQNQVDTQQKQYMFQLQSVNMTQDQIAAQTRLNEVTSKYQDQITALQNQLALATNPQDKATIQQHILDTQNAMGQAVANTKTYNTNLQAQKESPVAGMKEGMLEFAQTGLDVADQMKSAFNNLFSGLSDAIVQWAETGKLNFKDVLKSFLEMVLKMEIQALAAKVILSFLGVGGVFGGTSSGLANTNLDGSATFNSLTGAGHYYGQAKGGAWLNGLQKFAKGSAFANHIVSSPTLFKFAGGTGMMGEAGPEAIMPLTRGKDGKLGVQASGGGGDSSGNSVTVNVINNSSSQAQVQQSTNSDGSKLINVIIGEINNQIARGGSTYKTISQTFGLRRQGVPV